MTIAEPFDRSTIDRLGTLAYRVAYRILGQRQDAEDVAQEAVARASVRWAKISGHDEAWVARVASNLALGVVRKRRSRGEPPERSTVGHEPASLDRLALVEAIRALPRRQREVVVFRYLADLSEQAVADQLGCSVGTVKQHAHRGVAALRLSMGRVIPDEDRSAVLDEATRPLTRPNDRSA